MEVPEVVDYRNVTRKEEKFFRELFERVLILINGNRASSNDISNAIDKIVAYFRERGPAGACAIYNFSTLADFLGYFYWSSPLSAGVTRNKTLLAVRDCEEFRLRLQSPSLKIVSVGGGTGSDLVGLYSALYEVNCAFQSMEITIMDNNSNWKLFQQIVENHLRQHDFGNASRLINSKRIKTSFIYTDFRSKAPGGCWLDMKLAHIVWMKGVRSILRDDNERYIITENIISSMTPGALFVVIDPLAYDDFGLYEEKLQRIFSSNVGHRYALENFSAPYRIAAETNQEIIIFKKI